MICASAFVAFSCEPQKEDVAVTGISISPEKDTLLVGETLELTVSVLPEDATNQEYTLDCKSDVISLENNTVTALKKGTATITAIAAENGKTAICKITVIEENTDGPGNGEDGPGNGEDGPGNGEDGPGNGEDGPGNGEDGPGNGEDGPGNGGDEPNIPGAGEDFTETVGEYTFKVAVDGIDVTIDVTPSHDTYYFMNTFIKWQYDDFGEAWDQLIASEVNTALNKGKTMDDVCYKGNGSLVYKHDDPNVNARLQKNESYYVYVAKVAVVDGEVVVNKDDVVTVIFTTEERGSYDGEENIITITAEAAATSINVKTSTTTSEEYYITCMTVADYNGYFEVCTENEIMGSLYFRSNSTDEGYAVDNFKVSGNADVTFENLESGVNYMICAFGYVLDEEKGLNQPTTKLYKLKVNTIK